MDDEQQEERGGKMDLLAHDNNIIIITIIIVTMNDSEFLKRFIYYFWPCWVFIAAQEKSIAVASLIAEHGLSCSTACSSFPGR